MASYDNSRYTYEQVLSGTGYYKQDSNLTYSSGVKTMQTKLNNLGFWCGTPDGKFGAGTDAMVRNFQDYYSLTVDGAAGKNTLVKLDAVSPATFNFSKIGDDAYQVYFDYTNKRFMYNQQVVYETLKAAGLRNLAIAGFMGNFEAESGFKTVMSGTGGASGLAQWTSDRATNLQNYASALSKDSLLITVQAPFILEECKSSGTYKDSLAVECLDFLKDASTVKTVRNAADYVTALYERCHSHNTWAEIESCTSSSCSADRYSETANDYNKKYYLDTPKRRGYASSYYTGISNM